MPSGEICSSCRRIPHFPQRFEVWVPANATYHTLGGPISSHISVVPTDSHTIMKCCYYHSQCNRVGTGWMDNSYYNAIFGNKYIHQRFIRPFHYPSFADKGKGGKERRPGGSERHMIKKEKGTGSLFSFPSQINHYSKVISNQNPAYGFY